VVISENASLSINYWYKHWDKDVIWVLKVISPNGLTDKEIDTAGMLPLSLTGRLALDHIEGKTKTDIIATGAYCEILCLSFPVRVY